VHLNGKDFAAGGIFLLIGAFFAVDALRSLEMGTASRMGPGAFPLVLSGVLIMIGIATAGRAFFTQRTPFGHFPWRGVLLISFAPIVFGVTVRGLGLGPSVALLSIISAYASQRMGYRLAVLLTIGLTLLCIIIFSWGLGLPLEVIGPWIRK
jgi:hypothetical protein